MEVALKLPHREKSQVYLGDRLASPVKMLPQFNGQNFGLRNRQLAFESPREYNEAIAQFALEHSDEFIIGVARVEIPFASQHSGLVQWQHGKKAPISERKLNSNFYKQNSIIRDQQRSDSSIRYKSVIGVVVAHECKKPFTEMETDSN